MLLIRGNHWVAIRRSKGRPSQEDHLRCMLVSDRKANIHVNAYSPYYWSDNQSRDKNEYLIFYMCMHRVISQQHIYSTTFCLSLNDWVDCTFTVSLRYTFLQSGTFSLFRTKCNIVGTPPVSIFSCTLPPCLTNISWCIFHESARNMTCFIHACK